MAIAAVPAHPKQIGHGDLVLSVAQVRRWMFRH